MEAEKLQRLHDTLQKLAPKGKGGLGRSGFSVKPQGKDQRYALNSPNWMKFV